ncbi:MAG: 2-oxoglutarate dehydrogenase, E2 component, dihydrolipoamide succinyltransferase, partial [Actinomycetota bacterium]
VEVATDKVDTEIPSPYAGIVLKLLAAEDDTVPVGSDLAVIGDSTTSTPAVAPPPIQTAPTSPALTSPPTTLSPPPAASGDSGIAHTPPPISPASASAPPANRTQSHFTTSLDAGGYVTPLVRKLATEHGVDLARVTGTGVGGRIRKQDVLAAAESQRQPLDTPTTASALTGSPTGGNSSAITKRGTTERMSRLRRLIATRLVESLHTSAQLTTVVEVDVTKIARLRDRAKKDFAAREGVKLSFLPFFAQAAVEALKVHPTINASIHGDEITYHAEENLGIAVDTDKGLIVPVIRNTGELNIAGIARKVADLAARTRSGSIGPDDLGGGTFTLTNTGSRGALFDTPIVDQPQVAIMGTGTVVKRPVVIVDADGGETIAIRSMVYLALSYDHRIVDGADAARFLTTVKVRLEEGAFEADLGL